MNSSFTKPMPINNTGGIHVRLEPHFLCSNLLPMAVPAMNKATLVNVRLLCPSCTSDRGSAESLSPHKIQVYEKGDFLFIEKSPHFTSIALPNYYQPNIANSPTTMARVFRLLASFMVTALTTSYMDGHRGFPVCFFLWMLLTGKQFGKRTE
jgi:hypothetical protein